LKTINFSITWSLLSGRRSRFEIYVDVLTRIMEGARKPTQIMYGANLSYGPLREILASLLEQGLIREEPGPPSDKRTKTLYSLTSKGVNVVKYYTRAKRLVEVSNPRELV